MNYLQTVKSKAISSTIFIDYKDHNLKYCSIKPHMCQILFIYNTYISIYLYTYVFNVYITHRY